jgi:hypothetical protein
MRHAVIRLFNLVDSTFESTWKEATVTSLQEIILYYLVLKKTTQKNRITGSGAQTSTGESDQEIGVMLNRGMQTLHVLNLVWR